MQVRRVAEHPRITKPFSDESWEAQANTLGQKVDADLKAHDVRLTMGGEPTFVSIDDFQSAEWNTDAVGPTKRQTSPTELIRRLRETLRPGGLLHYGQGKWYPGESLPRWTFSLYWRKDGKPIWHDPATDRRRRCGHRRQAGAGRPALMAGIAAELGDRDDDMIIPAYEDPAEWLIKEGSLPENVDPANSKLESDPEGTLVPAWQRCSNAASPTPTGYVLPVQAWNARAGGNRRWVSERWRTRRGKLFLIPGDRPIGFRMPLGTLPYVPPVTSIPTSCTTDPIDPARDRRRILARRSARVAPCRKPPARAVTVQQPTATSRTSPGSAGDIEGCGAHRDRVEPRDGRLCVFMPPVEAVEDYLELVAAAEETPLAALASRSISKATHRRYDPRINVIRVAPDPGVIEVNIQPASSWDDCRRDDECDL